MPNPDNIRLIALDLDGTLLNSAKELTPRSRAALAAAAEAGIEIVPSTGRFFGGMPEAVRALPFLRYAITINGAQVYDIRNDSSLYSALIPLDEAIAIMEFLDGMPLIYDCYMDNHGWMTQSMWDCAEEFAPDEHYRKMMRGLRKPVPELKAFLREQGRDVQKVQFFTKDLALRDRLLDEVGRRFPALIVSSSLANNVEINHEKANKGDALLCLAEKLGLSRSQTMAFGDGLNDLRMLADAGTGVAMGNARPEVVAVADRVTLDNDSDGVAAVIETLLSD